MTQYQLVILIKLRMLTNDDYPPGRDYSPFDLVEKEYASRISMQEKDGSRFEEQCIKGQVLWLLDGYDEFVQNIPKQLQKVFNFILNKYHHILTSRPYSITLPYDVKMEITGFTDDNIRKYIEQFFTQISNQLEDAASEGHKLKSFLESNPSIWGIAHIPVNLELICSLWGDIDRSQPTILTMTGLYDNITEWLLRRYLLKNKNLLQAVVDEMFPNDVYQRCHKELLFLEALAFSAMKSSTLILQPSSLEQALADANVMVEDRKHIFNIGILKSFDGKATGNQSQAKKEYYFVHLSFQEHFAARYLVNTLRSSAYQDSIEFIRRNKYNQRFTLVFVFASGLLAGKYLSVARNAFWNALFDEPIDLVGFRHMQILISCLEEVSDKSDIGHYAVIIENVSKWMDYVVFHGSSKIFQQLCDSLKRSIALSREPILQEKLIKLYESSDSRNKPRICFLISALSNYNAYSEHLLLLTRALKNKNEDYNVRSSVCDALGGMSVNAATSEVINNLVSAALDDGNGGGFRSADNALAKMCKKGATSKVISNLLNALDDKNEDVRWRACHTLDQMGGKAATREVISRLVNALKDESEEVRSAAHYALGSLCEKAATSEVISELVRALDDTNEDVRVGVYEAFAKMGKKAATSEVISKLVSALDDENERVRRYACDALREMGEKAATSEVISKLVYALGDKNEDVRWCAYKALDKMDETAATSEVISKLVNALDDKDGYVRKCACKALGSLCEKAATSDVISKLVRALDDENRDVKFSAYEALAKMGEKAVTSEVISRLVHALDDKEECFRERACDALGKMGQKAATSEVISKLVTAFTDKNFGVRTNACDCFANMDERAATSEVISKLVRALDDKDNNVRWRAFDALAEMGEKAVTSEVINRLVHALDDESEYASWRACYALGEMGEKAATNEVISKLGDALTNKRFADRTSACDALSKIGQKAATSEGISKLVSALPTLDDPTRWAVDRWLSKISVSSPVLIELTPETVEKLLTCIEKNLLKDLTFMPADALIEVYLHTRWSSWLSVAVLVTLLQGVAVTIINDTVVVYSSKEPVKLHESNREVLDKLVETFSKQADRFDLPCMRLRKSFVPVEPEETLVSSSRQICVVDAK